MRNQESFNQRAIQPAVAEVNLLCDFGCRVEPVLAGRKVVKLKLSWWQKNTDELKAAFRELQASKVGRRARLRGTVEHLAPPLKKLTSATSERLVEKATPRTVPPDISIVRGALDALANTEAAAGNERVIIEPKVHKRATSDDIQRQVTAYQASAAADAPPVKVLILSGSDEETLSKLRQLLAEAGIKV